MAESRSFDTSEQQILRDVITQETIIWATPAVQAWTYISSY